MRTSPKTELDEGRWQEARQELRAANYARALCPKLLTEAGIRPYLKMLEKHGDLAHQLVSGKLIVFAIDGASVGQIPGWRYFRNALRDEVHRQQMADHGLRPGDSLGAWRDLPVEVPF